MGYIGSDPVRNDSVSTAQLADDAVTSPKIVDDIVFTNVTASNNVSASGTVQATSFQGIFEGALSSSAQIATSISGSFTAASSSFSTRVTRNETSASSLTSDSSSFSTRITAATASISALKIDSGSFSTRVTDNNATGSILAGSGNIQGLGSTNSPTFADLTATGTVTAQEFHTEFVSASIVYRSGSTKFGDTSDDIHQFSGSLRVTGSGNHYFQTGNVGIGTTGPGELLNINSAAAPTDSQFLIEANNLGGLSTTVYSADNMNIGFDLYRDAGDWKSLDAGSNFWIKKGSDLLQFGYDSGITVGSAVTMNTGMVLDTTGNVGIGNTSPNVRLGQKLDIATSDDYGGMSLSTWSTVTGDGAILDFKKSGNATIGTHGAVADDEQLGYIVFRGSDGVEFLDAAVIKAEVDGAISGSGTDDMPGRLIFATTADEASSTTERMRIDSSGNVGIGATPTAAKLEIHGGGYNTSLLIKGSSSHTGIKFVDSAGNTDGLIYADGGEIGFLDDDENWAVKVVTDTSTSLLVNNSIKLLVDTNSRISLSNNDSGTSNTIFGKTAGDSDGAGDYNVFIGELAGGAGTQTDAADDNTGVGYAALTANTTGDENVAIGRGALAANTTGTQNVAIGAYALTANDDSHYNVAIGREALKTSDGGASNVAIGRTALMLLTTGDNNVAIGTNAGDALEDGASNIAIGQDALGASTSVAKSVAIGRGAMSQDIVLVAANGSVAIGYFALANITSGAGNTAVGYEAGSSTATTSYNTFIGHQAGATTNNTHNTFVGWRAGNDVTSGYGNTAVGSDAGSNADVAATGDYNTSVGHQAGENIQGAAQQNTSVGAKAGHSTTTGNYNTAVGYYAGGTIATNSFNTAVGRSAVAEGDCAANTGVGYEALKVSTGSGNVAVGLQALVTNTSGYNNTAIGYQSMYSNTTGETKSTAVGYKSLYSNTTGPSNVAVGDRALYNTDAEANTGVGYVAGYDITSGDNNLCLGNFAGRTGSPSGAITTADDIVCIGNDSIQTLYCTQSSISTSDRRDKTDITDFDGGLDWVNAMQPKTFNWDRRSWYIDDESTSQDILDAKPDGTKKRDDLQLGFLAQDILDIEQANGYADNNENSLLVNLTDDGTRYGLAYERLVPVLVNAIKELSAKVTALEAQVSGSS